MEGRGKWVKVCSVARSVLTRKFSMTWGASISFSRTPMRSMISWVKTAAFILLVGWSRYKNLFVLVLLGDLRVRRHRIFILLRFYSVMWRLHSAMMVLINVNTRSTENEISFRESPIVL